MSSKKKINSDEQWAPPIARGLLISSADRTTVVLVESFACPGSSCTASGRCFQFNYVEVATPSIGEKVLTDAGGRIWLPKVRIQDFSGSTVIGMRQKSALDLAGINPEASDAKEKFSSLVNSRQVQFPLMASTLELRAEVFGSTVVKGCSGAVRVSIDAAHE